jgi:hypothetical protein
LTIFIKINHYDTSYLIYTFLLLTLCAISFAIFKRNKRKNMINKPNIPPHLKNLKPLIDSVRNGQQNSETAVQQPPPQPQQQPQPQPQQQVHAPVVQDPVQTYQSPVQTQQPTPQNTSVKLSGPIADVELREEKTYLSLGSKEHGFLEIDLISNREKGKEIRYLDIQLHGWTRSGDEVGVPVAMAITNKEQFEKLKKFFSSLSWED